MRLLKLARNEIDAYLATCRFGWSNAWPLLDTHFEEFFKNLIDDTNAAKREKLATRVLSGLRRAVS